MMGKIDKCISLAGKFVYIGYHGKLVGNTEIYVNTADDGELFAVLAHCFNGSAHSSVYTAYDYVCHCFYLLLSLLRKRESKQREKNLAPYIQRQKFNACFSISFIIFRAVTQDRPYISYYKILRSFIIATIFALLSGDISQRGSLISSPQKPSSAIAALTGMGLVSQKSALMK